MRNKIAAPTNIGAVFRSAAALGVDAVLTTPRCADPLYRRKLPGLDGHGVPGAVDADAPVAWRIQPVTAGGVDSLDVVAAAAVAMWALRVGDAARGGP